MVEKGNISFIGSQSVFADEYGNENGAYDDFLDNLSNYYGLEITGTFVDSYGNFAFTLEGGGYLSPEQFTITAEVIEYIFEGYPDFVPEEPEADPNDIYHEFVEWYNDHIAQIPDPSSNAVNNITDDCLKALVQNVIDGDGENNPFSNILKTIFGAGSEIDITFNQYSNSIGSNVDGYATGSQYHLEIYLNLSALNSSSSEYITATIYHEILHAFLFTQGITNEIEQHNIIANQWRESISGQLREDYPSLSQAEADALAWGGLAQTQLWQQMLQDDSTNNTGITGAISQKNQNHKNLNNQNNSTHGTHCN